MKHDNHYLKTIFFFSRRCRPGSHSIQHPQKNPTIGQSFSDNQPFPPLRLQFPVIVLCILSLTVSARQMVDCTVQIFPPDHALNMPVDSLPLHSNSSNYIASIGATTALHPDFGTSWNDDGTDRQMGIPYNVVGAGQLLVPIAFILYDNESDPGPWPIPRNPFIETVFDWKEMHEGDRHMLIIDTNARILYETGNVFGNADGTAWEGGCGAVFNLDGYSLRPEKWTSADAAGLPIFPLLIRYDEVERARISGGEIHHAIRFTVQRSQRAYLWPARHYASSVTDVNLAPMGLRVRLKADFDLSSYSPRMQVILRTMKKYGMIVADNGSNWYFQGTHDERWDDEELNTLKKLRGNNFEVVDITSWTNRSGFDPSSGKVPQASEIKGKSTHPITPTNGITITRNSGSSGPSYSILYYLPTRGKVTISVYDVYGRMVTTFQHGPRPAGLHSIVWNMKNSRKKSIGRGTYFIRLHYNDGYYMTGKIMQLL